MAGGVKAVEGRPIVNWKRFFGAVFFAFLVATVFDILLNAVMLRSAWAASAQCWRPVGEMNQLVPLGWAAMLLIILVQGALFVRTRWQGMRRGLEFGLWLGLAAFVGIAGGMTSVVSWPMRLIVAMAGQQFVNNLITGFSLGWLYRPGVGH